jgi:thiol-disulfide isomerase/thioredoxin
MFPPVVAVVALAVPQPLTIGRPAPKFDAAGFVKGEPFAELTRDTVYVVEFSGTQCAPCVRAMPVLTELQKKHPDVVFVSVYGESEKAVREAIGKHDDRIGFRVALDREGAMDRTWMEAAGQAGIPAVFVVDKAGAVAWVGSPFDLAGPLDRILAGTFDPARDVLRVRYARAEMAAAESRRAREDRVRKASDAISQCLRDGRRADAARLVDQALRDFPGEAAGFELSRMFLWATDPATEDRAVEWAIGRVVELHATPGGWRSGEFGNIGKSLMWAAVETKSARLADTLAVLVEREEAMLARVRPSYERDNARMMCPLLLAWLHDKIGGPGGSGPAVPPGH